MRAASLSPTATKRGPLGSRRVLALASDERLVDQIRRGNEVAFEVVFERHGPTVLGFCRHMLGSSHEAEDAVQQTFASAHRALVGDRDRDITLKPWLFTVARNRCLSMLRARHEEPLEHVELPTAGLSEQVEQRAELRSLLADVHELPDEQRAALLLSELGDLSHAEVADALGCQVARVKALVFRARSALIARRTARETPCEQIQQELAVARRGGLRRTELRLHTRDCPACRAYRAEVKHQRQMLAVALPVAPTVGLKSSVLAAVGVGGGAAGSGAALGGALGASLAKVAVVGVLAGGGVAAGEAVLDTTRDARPAPDRAAAAPASVRPQASAPSPGSQAVRSEAGPATRGVRRPLGTRPAKQAGRRSSTRARGRAGTVSPGQAVREDAPRAGRGNAARGSANRGRVPVDAPPAATPVRRGPPATPPGAGKAPGRPAQKVEPAAGGGAKTPPAASPPQRPSAQPKPSRTARP